MPRGGDFFAHIVVDFSSAVVLAMKFGEFAQRALVGDISSSGTSRARGRRIACLSLKEGGGSASEGTEEACTLPREGLIQIVLILSFREGLG